MSTASERPRRITIREVAERAKVSVATASYVLSGSTTVGARVSDATSQRVRAVAAELDYRPNRMARSVRTGKTGVIQLVLHMLSDPWTVGLAETLTSLAPQHGLTALIAVDSDYAAALSRVEFDAALVVARVGSTPDECRLALGPVASKVAIYAPRLDPAGFDVVRFDDQRASALAVNHLLAHHAAIACMASEADLLPQGRVEVFHQTMAAAGRAVLEGFVAIYERNVSDPYRVAHELLTRPERPTAIFAAADFAGLAAMQVARELGLRVPQDVAVIGIGDAAQSRAAGLSSVGAVDFGPSIADFVFARALGKDLRSDRLLDLDVTLFARESTLTR